MKNAEILKDGCLTVFGKKLEQKGKICDAEHCFSNSCLKEHYHPAECRCDNCFNLILLYSPTQYYKEGKNVSGKKVKFRKEAC